MVALGTRIGEAARIPAEGIAEVAQDIALSIGETVLAFADLVDVAQGTVAEGTGVQVAQATLANNPEFAEVWGHLGSMRDPPPDSPPLPAPSQPADSPPPSDSSPRSPPGAAHEVSACTGESPGQAHNTRKTLAYSNPRNKLL